MAFSSRLTPLLNPPAPKRSWKGVLDVSREPEPCIQGIAPFRGNEDCLYLKVYSPKLPQKQNKLPVLVWIYGGAFFVGEPDFNSSSPEPLLKEGVIVAAVQYRVGLFGFLSTENSIVPGNVGLKDQILGLKWIKDNIENFGGDPNRITLMGQSAGSASVAYLLQSPQTTGLYSGVVMLSGNTLDTWTLTRTPLNFAKNVATHLGIKFENVANMVDRLREESPQKIQEATSTAYLQELAANPLHGLPLGPVVEPALPGAVINGKSYDLLKKGEFVRVPIVIGHTSSEAYFKDHLSIAIKLLLSALTTPSELVPIGMNVKNPLQRYCLGMEIIYRYFGSLPIPVQDIKLVKWISEDQFVRGINEAVRLYSRKVPVYYYEFAHEGELFGIKNRTLPGVGHSEDLGYLFDFGYQGTKTDYMVRDRYVRLITNFAKYRTPTRGHDSLLQNIDWLPNHHGTAIVQLKITDNLTIVIDPYKKNMDFWRNYYVKFGPDSIDTY